MHSIAFRNALSTLMLMHGFLISASQNTVDSLKNVISSPVSYREKINAYLAFGENYALRNFDETLTIENEGILLAKRNNDPVSLANLKRYIGSSYYFKGNYTEAATYYYASISLLENTNEKKSLALAYNELAKLYRKTRTLPRASLNYDKALALFIQLKDSGGISMIQNESGVVFEYMNNYPEAIKRYTASYNIDKALKNGMGVSYALSNLAGVYTIQNKLTVAEAFLKEALEMRRHYNDRLALALIYSDVAANYYSQKKYAQATIYTDSSNNIAQIMKYPELQTANYKLLSDIFRETGDYKNAFIFLEKRTSLYDSLLDKDKLKQIEELNGKYETLKKEKIIQQQRFEINKRNYWITAGVIFLVLLSLAGFSSYKRNQLKQRAKLQEAILFQQEISTKAVMEAEENERERIAKDLHDGIGQMMSVAKMNLSALENDLMFSTEKQHFSYGKIMALVDDSCKEIRAVSHNMMPNALLKSNLAEALRTFVNQVDHPDLRIDLYTEGLEEKLNNNTETVLYRVIQECMNNVIKHAVATTLDISVIKDIDGISATVEDNGKGFDQAGIQYADGIGVKNIKSRILYLKGSVEFISAPGKGTLVSLHIPKEI